MVASTWVGCNFTSTTRVRGFVFSNIDRPPPLSSSLTTHTFGLAAMAAALVPRKKRRDEVGQAIGGLQLGWRTRPPAWMRSSHFSEHQLANLSPTQLVFSSKSSAATMEAPVAGSTAVLMRAEAMRLAVSIESHGQVSSVTAAVSTLETSSHLLEKTVVMLLLTFEQFGKKEG